MSPLFSVSPHVDDSFETSLTLDALLADSDFSPDNVAFSAKPGENLKRLLNATSFGRVVAELVGKKTALTQIILEVKPFETVGFDNHYRAYHVRECDANHTFLISDMLQYPFVCNLVAIGYNVAYELYVVLRKPL